MKKSCDSQFREKIIMNCFNIPNPKNNNVYTLKTGF